MKFKLLHQYNPYALPVNRRTGGDYRLMEAFSESEITQIKSFWTLVYHLLAQFVCRSKLIFFDLSIAKFFIFHRPDVIFMRKTPVSYKRINGARYNKFYYVLEKYTLTSAKMVVVQTNAQRTLIEQDYNIKLVKVIVLSNNCNPLFIRKNDLINKQSVSENVFGLYLGHETDLRKSFLSYKIYSSVADIVRPDPAVRESALAHLMNCSFVFHPSILDCFSNVICEALYYRKPLVCCRNPENCEILGKDYPYFIKENMKFNDIVWNEDLEKIRRKYCFDWNLQVRELINAS